MSIKKNFSVLLAAAMLFTSVSLMPVSAEESGEKTPVVKITFDEETAAYTGHGNASLADGRDGKALKLDGSNGTYADINGIADTLATVDGDFTISVWCKPDKTDVWARIYDLGNSDTKKYAFLTVSSGAMPRFVMTQNGNAAGAEQIVNSDKALSTGAWHNIVVTRSGANTTYYTDGLVTGTSSDLKLSFKDLGKMDNYYLGKSQYPDALFAGMIDDFTVYDCALTEKGVQKIAAEAYEDYKNQLIYQNNCFIINTRYYDDNGNEMFSYMPDGCGEVYISDKYIYENIAHYTINNINGKNDNNIDIDNITAYVAQYNSNGALTRVEQNKPEIDHSVYNDVCLNSFVFNKLPDTVRTELFIWDGMKPVSETAPENNDLTVSVDVQNYTAQSGMVSVDVWTKENDEPDKFLMRSDNVMIDSLKSEQFTLTIPSENISSKTKEILIRVFTDSESYDVATLYCGIASPVAAPADSGTTTDGAHDPSIVKFQNDDTYYVYSSHHLIFTSEDLINWKKYDFTNINAKDISPKTYKFISGNYTNTTMNGTYWAPDVIYKEGDDHPYWMYISLSCGLGGRNSAISLMKSDSPLFWADKKADIVDAGVVFATKENSAYITNAIDANIYTDTDGQQYFVWGSFWGGIQAAKLLDNGFVEGVDYTSDAKILSSCQSVRTTVYSQRGGVAGPEGAWMINHGDFRYMFTSYGWLGSNYNTRIARSALSMKFSENMGSQLVDANNISMGGQHSSGSTSVPSGYKLIGSYRLGDGSYTINGNDSDGYSVERGTDDAHVYYGPGHNSAINADNGESFYVSHTRKDATEIAATLQIRKMLFTKDGWPVVSPVTYAGEKEQALPKEMLAGTYDLASVGHMKRNGSTIKARNFDLPVFSSKVTLNADGTLADSLGTWTFDGDHTVTLTFAADGNEAKDEFYKKGDVMTMYALYGYDKDEKEPVIALTGTDQNHITQFAKKSMANEYKTPAKTPEFDIEPLSLEKSEGNPELGFDENGNVLYAGDPAATVIGDTVYLIAGHDTASNESYVMPEWVVYTSKNMTDWEYKGVAMKATDISWRSNDTSAWASQMTPYTNKETGEMKYYLYFCTWDKTSGGRQSIGVAVADKPEGPYIDIGQPLVKGDFTTPESASHDDIDPTVLIDTDENGVEHRYLAWGNTRYYVCELNEDMTSVKDIDGDGDIVMHKDIKERKIKSLSGNTFTEAPWLYKRDGKYYLFFAANWREEMAYATCDTPLGRYDYKQTIMPPSSTANTNHPSVIDFNGKTYFIYHNGALPHGSGFRRSVCIQELEFDEDGNVYPLTETSIGLSGKASVIKSKNGKFMAHDNFRNSLANASYPISTSVSLKDGEDGYNTAWEIVKAKSAPEGQEDYYVSIQSVNKPGLYLKATDSGITLTQDADGKQGEAMTFRTIKGIDGTEDTVSFESASMPGRYITVLGDTIMLSYGTVPKDAVFTIGEATQKDAVSINIAERESDPVAAADISNDFNSATAGNIITLGTTDQTYTAQAGVTLYVGSRGSGGSTSTGWLMEASSGVDSSKALVMISGRWATSSRGPRMQLTTPPIPDGCTVTGKFSAKLGTGGELHYNDSTGTFGGTNITDKLSTSEWKEIKVVISNDSDTYTRKIYINDVEIASDYLDVFPVFWGKSCDENSATYKTYIDNVSITTTQTVNE